MTSLEHIAKHAVGCDYCFGNLGVEHAQISIAQPRWCGPNYQRAIPKVAVVVTNPAGGRIRSAAIHQHLQLLLEKFCDGGVTFCEVFDGQRDDLENFGRRRFKPFIEQGLGFDLNDIALLNIAW